MSTVVPSLSGPKRPHDRVSMCNLSQEFKTGLTAKVGFKGYGLTEQAVDKKVKINFKGEEY